MRKLFAAAFLSLFMVCILAGSAFGESYANGSEGLKCGTPPPPGFYYKMYNAYLSFDKVVDKNGNEVPMDFDATLFVNVHRFLWISKDIKFLGADFGSNFFIPLWYKDVSYMNPDATKYDESNFGLGDIIIEPVVLGWHGPRYDAVAALALFLPTGDHDEAADPGEDMYTFMPTLGATYYPDSAKTWSLSLLGRYEIHSKKDDANYTPGDDFHIEYGIGKTLAKFYDVGMIGYCQWQVSKDRSAGRATTSDKESGYGIGPEISAFCPKHKLIVALRTLFEFDVEGGRAPGRPEGHRTFLNITKIF